MTVSVIFSLHAFRGYVTRKLSFYVRRVKPGDHESSWPLTDSLSSPCPSIGRGFLGSGNSDTILLFLSASKWTKRYPRV